MESHFRAISLQQNIFVPSQHIHGFSPHHESLARLLLLHYSIRNTQQQAVDNETLYVRYAFESNCECHRTVELLLVVVFCSGQQTREVPYM